MNKPRQESEQTIQKRIMLALSRAGSRIFRNNVGAVTYRDPHRSQSGGPVTQCPRCGASNGAKRVVRYGLCKGSSDVIGWTQHRVTDADIGRLVAIFTAIEVKRPGGHATAEQCDFIDAVRAHGGIAGIAISPEQALEIVELWRGAR